MTRAKPSLQPHLLTRSDLELLQVPAADVSAWLASGSLEAIGALPDDSATGGDPVFAVTANALRQDLALRLLEIDKSVVVMTPPRVRSLLQRFADSAHARADAAHEEALAAVVAEVQADVGELMQFAAPEPPAGVGAFEEHEEHEEREQVDAEDDGDSCFDAGDLERALDALEPPGEPPGAAPSEDAMPARDPAPIAPPTTSGNDTTMATEPATALLPSPPAARATPPWIVPAPEAGDVVLAATITRVETFLERLQQSLLQLAQRPAPAPPAAPAPATDVTPIVQAVQAGSERAALSAATTTSALETLSERVGGLGAQFASGVDKALRAALARERAATPLMPPSPPPPLAAAIAPTITLPRQDRMPAALLALATSVLAWSLLFWWKTESQQLALGTLVGANLIGCCLLAARRARA
jgi:hypothetical protein